MSGGDDQRELVLSYHRVRTALGILGLALPVVLVVGGIASNLATQPSLSDYYHTLLRDFFVGSLFAIGIFLISYKGYPRTRKEFFSDDWVTTIAGLAAFGVALFPNEVPQQPITSPLQLALGILLTAGLHYFSATLFLMSLAYMSLFKFTFTANPVRTRIYITCGTTILVATLGVMVASYFKIRGPAGPQTFVVNNNLVLWLESVAIWAFAISWLTKGKAERMLALRRQQDAAAPSKTRRN
jgi:hypothetical protein